MSFVRNIKKEINLLQSVDLFNPNYTTQTDVAKFIFDVPRNHLIEMTTSEGPSPLKRITAMVGEN